MAGEPQIFLTKSASFDAAHNLPHYEGACERLHGHTWNVRIKLGPFDPSDLDAVGIAVDFKTIKGIVTRYDHQYLNHFFDRPTAELIALGLFKELQKYRCIYVEVDESPTSTCRVEASADK